MNPRILIAGIGNVLLGDDAVGPYVVHLLESAYTFGASVEIADLGTPALDLTHRIAGLDAVILVDCMAPCDHPPGTILLFRTEDILRVQPAQRLDPPFSRPVRVPHDRRNARRQPQRIPGDRNSRRVL
jgi:hydrogenase maturation protease